MDLTAIPTLASPKQRDRRITWPDAVAICELVAKRMTESEAALALGYSPRRWFVFKDRAKMRPKIDELLTRTRAAQLKSHLENIEDAQTGKNGHRPDWRASAHLLSVKAPDRYAQAQAQAGNVTTNQIVIAAGGEEQLRKLIAVYVGQKEINAGTCQETSLLADAVKSQDNSTKPADSSKAIDF